MASAAMLSYFVMEKLRKKPEAAKEQHVSAHEGARPANTMGTLMCQECRQYKPFETVRYDRRFLVYLCIDCAH